MCLFCEIAKGTIPSKIAFQDETVVAFHDIAPQAPVHVLIIPRKHIESAQALTMEDNDLLCHMFEVARKLAAELGVADSGYRLITNIGKDAGQSVAHLHLHLIGGKTLNWNY